MHTFYNFLFFFFRISLSFAFHDELSTLLSIKSSLIDPLNYLKDWKVPSNETQIQKSLLHCNWTGIICNSKGFVQKLDLSNMNLSGCVSDDTQHLQCLSYLNISRNGFESSLPESLFNLTSLEIVDLSLNNFIGLFPTGLGKVSGLISVNASSNNFSGFLPYDLENATSLEILDLRGNFFGGSIPKWIKNLQKLKFLGLSGNNFTGKIPGEIGELSSLETVIMGYNWFEGEIPVELGNLASLKYLDLAVGSFEGQIPAQLGRLKNLDTIFLYRNKFSGSIPWEIGNITSLVFLDLSDNSISGEIPLELAELKNLQLLNLMCNNLTGPIPRKLAELTNLEVLGLWKNSLSGSLPENLGRNSPLQWLDVSSNSLSGEIPEGLCSSGNLTKLILFNNSFSGPIPEGLSTCFSLVRVRVQNNRISGTIPIGLGNLPRLQRLELENNNLAGKIPEDIALSLSLSFIDVTWNYLESSLPSNILSIPSLQTFMASNNNLEGNIPDEFQDAPSLSVLDLSSNHLSGKIPESITSCGNLVRLNLRNNELTEGIPRAIATMPTLAILDLSNNSLTGKIPENLGSSPALEMLNLSYNNLEGPVPRNGILMTISLNDLVGNVGLCGGVLPPCNQDFAASIGKLKDKGIDNIIKGLIIGISIICTLGLAFFVGRSLYTRWHLYNSLFYDWFNKSNEEWPWRLVAFQRVSFTSSDILDCIKEPNVIGMGGTGIVYKAETYRPPSLVAVKKLWRPGTDIENGNDLLREVNLLGRLRHRNILRLLGYLHNETNVMILYEYMPNGNLGTALHSKEGNLLVDWVSRYNIAVGVAQGLKYLHHDCHPPVIHRDIKSNNILIDGNLEARIADFGLAKMMIHKNETVSMVAGSYGYIAPEYGYCMKVDEKTDIYSYGVVLLELLTGKRPTEPEFGESIDIVEWVRRKIYKRALEEALDPNLAGQCKHVQEEMLLVLRIALLCTAKLPKDRPSMRDIITMLGEAKPRRKSVCHNGVQQIATKDMLIFTASPVAGL